jgi:lipoprotein-anchoring transpeptidase ErfK/SrfK
MRGRRNLITMLVLVAVVALLAAAAVAAAGEPVASPAAVATPAPTATPALTITSAPAAVTAGVPVTLTVRLPSLPSGTVTLSRQGAGATGFRVVGPLVTSALGVATYRVLPHETTVYRVEYAGDSVQWLSAAAEVTVSVRPRVTFFASARVYRGDRAGLAVTVHPAHPGATVTLEQWKDGAWAEWRSLQLGPDSRARLQWRPDGVGTLPLRVVMPADAGHLEGRSRVCKVAVIEPNPYDVPIGVKGIIVVDISQYRLHFFSYGREVRSFPCVTGRPSLPTPLGHFKIYARGMWPGGPYGARIMSYHPPCAIHGTNEPWLLKRFPRNFSHGCTRLANANAIWLYDHAPLGTPVWNVK